MKFILLITGIVFVHQTLSAQAIDLESQRFIGERDGEYHFFQYKQRTGTVKPHLLGYSLRADLTFAQTSLEPWHFEEIKIFTSNEIEAFYHYRDNKLRLKVGEKDSTYVITDDVNVFGNSFLAFHSDSNLTFISSHNEAHIYLFDRKTFEFSILPLIGSNLFIRGDYLFFEAPRFSDNYSSFPKDIYRVSLDNLKNPEKVLIQVNKWFPFTEQILYASTDPYLEINDNKTYGFYNLQTNMVAESPGLATQDIIEIRGEPFYLKISEKNGEMMFQLEELSMPPTTFSYNVIETSNQDPKGSVFQWYNIPLIEKSLTGTFITPYLLYEAAESDLKALSKNELRILRNTFFAFQGYKFSSEDLTQFFDKFDWYRKMKLGERPNEDIVIWPDEVIRVDLIKSIENSKN